MANSSTINNSPIAPTNSGTGQYSGDGSIANSSTVPYYDGGKSYGGLDNVIDFFTGGQFSKNNERKYQQGLDDTAVQRRVGDLKQAGLNPVLAANSASASVSGVSNNSSSYVNKSNSSVLKDIATSAFKFAAFLKIAGMFA